MEALGQNLRYAARMLRWIPGFTVVAILTLALGIGANVAAFTVVRAVLLNPLPFPRPEQLVRVYDDLRGSNGHDVGMSAPELWDLRDRSDVFENISAIWSTDANMTGAEKPERVELLGTSTNYFGMLGAHPQIGLLYNQNDERPGFIDGAVLSDGFGGALSEVIRRCSARASAWMAISIRSWRFVRLQRYRVGCMGSELSSTLEPETAAAGGGPLPLSSRYIRLGPFQVDQHRQEVQGEVVTREEIRVRLWPADTHVNCDANVNTTVNKLRQALGDSDEPLYIETIRRKGYCLVIAAEYADSPLPRAEGRDGAPNGSLNGGRINSAPAKSELWITFGVIGLILAGMLLGAVITRLWIMHFASPVIGGN
jgi:hypothetical protein